MQYHQERLVQLQQERELLQARVAELEATSVGSADLEDVVVQLRSRVAEFEAKESRVADLRQECRSLRARLTQLVASTLDEKALQDDCHNIKQEIQLKEEQDCSSVENKPPYITGMRACAGPCESA